MAVEGPPTTIAPVDWPNVCLLGVLGEEIVNERVTPGENTLESAAVSLHATVGKASQSPARAGVRFQV